MVLNREQKWLDMREECTTFVTNNLVRWTSHMKKGLTEPQQKFFTILRNDFHTFYSAADMAINEFLTGPLADYRESMWRLTVGDYCNLLSTIQASTYLI